MRGPNILLPSQLRRRLKLQTSGHKSRKRKQSCKHSWTDLMRRALIFNPWAARSHRSLATSFAAIIPNSLIINHSCVNLPASVYVNPFSMCGF